MRGRWQGGGARSPKVRRFGGVQMDALQLLSYDRTERRSGSELKLLINIIISGDFY